MSLAGHEVRSFAAQSRQLSLTMRPGKNPTNSHSFSSLSLLLQPLGLMAQVKIDRLDRALYTLIVITAARSQGSVYCSGRGGRDVQGSSPAGRAHAGLGAPCPCPKTTMDRLILVIEVTRQGWGPLILAVFPDDSAVVGTLFRAGCGRRGWSAWGGSTAYPLIKPSGCPRLGSRQS